MNIIQIIQPTAYAVGYCLSPLTGLKTAKLELRSLVRCSLGVPELLVYPVNPVHPCEINSYKDRPDEQDVSLTQGIAGWGNSRWLTATGSAGVARRLRGFE